MGVGRSYTRRLKLAAAEWLEIPKDALLDIPRVTLVGGVQLLVENHKGILSFEPQVLRLSLTQGELIIRGNHLRVKSILSKEMVIEGTIEHVQYTK